MLSIQRVIGLGLGLGLGLGNNPRSFSACTTSGDKGPHCEPEKKESRFILFFILFYFFIFLYREFSHFLFIACRSDAEEVHEPVLSLNLRFKIQTQMFVHSYEF